MLVPLASGFPLVFNCFRFLFFFVVCFPLFYNMLLCSKSWYGLSFWLRLANLKAILLLFQLLLVLFILLLLGYLPVCTICSLLWLILVEILILNCEYLPLKIVPYSMVSSCVTPDSWSVSLCLGLIWFCFWCIHLIFCLAFLFNNCL